MQNTAKAYDYTAAHPRTEQPQPLLEPLRRSAETAAPATAHHDFLEFCARSERGLPRPAPHSH
ncbi:MAG: hypothetical protein NVV63_01225 [Opitutus sp.]|nr:hypothetical protein [Opitutus sp.]